MRYYIFVDDIEKYIKIREEHMAVENVMERDGEGHFVWLVVSEVVLLVSTKNAKPPNVTRNIERWCASGVLAPYAHKASREQILTLVYACRIQGIPQKMKGVYLIHRDGLAHIDDRPKRGWPKDTKRPHRGRRIGASDPERTP